MSLYQRGATWWVYILHDGKRLRRSTGTTDATQAQRIHDQIKADLWNKKHKPDNHIFGEALEIWLETGPKGLPDKYRIKALNLKHATLAELTEKRLAEILVRFKGSTKNRVINLLTATLNCAVARGWISKIPHMARVKTKDARTRWLTLDEWRRLESELPCHLRQMARFAVSTGLRENNVIGLEWSQIDLSRRVAWIHPDQTKSGKAIGVPLSDTAMRALESQRETSTGRWVFVYNDKPVTKTSTKAWKAALVRAGIDVFKDDLGRTTSSFRWHDLRHTWASWHVMNGTPIEVLQKLGGWRTLSMVLRYAHLAPEHLAKYADNAVPRRLIDHTTV
ncbi:MAG: site-specific integrase [Sulfuriferula sp.]